MTAKNSTRIKQLKEMLGSLSDEQKMMPFEHMDPSNRVINIFKARGIKTPSDFLEIPNNKILGLPGLGTKSLVNITKMISSLLEQKWELPNIQEVTNSRESWFEQYFNVHPEAKSYFLERGINSNKSYIKHRSSLPENIQREADKFHFQESLNIINKDDPLEVLEIAPLWLLEMDILYFAYPVRFTKLISSNEIKKTGDLFKIIPKNLKNLKHVGKKSMELLAKSIITAEKKGLPPSKQNPKVSRSTLKECLRQSFEGIQKEKYRRVFDLRLGFNGPSKTLEEIGLLIGLTRERVRQIQKKNIQKIIKEEYWDDELKFKIEDMLNDPNKPLYLNKLSELDPWFSGFEEEPILLQRVLENFSRLNLKFIKLDGNCILANIDTEQWLEIRSQLLGSFEYGLYHNYTLEDIEVLIESELTAFGAKELADLMFSSIFPLLNFASSNEDLVLSSVGKSMSSYLKIILDSSETPLHYSSLRSLYEEKYSVEISERNIHARLSYKGFLLYGRGVFGTRKHFPISDHIAIEIKQYSEKIINRNNKKQWHASEIANIIKRERPDLSIDKLDEYLLNIILNESGELSYLGKMVWTGAETEDSEIGRLHITKALTDILRDNGGPMTLKELESAIIKIRGTGSNFGSSFHSNEFYSRVNPATWGLLNRDFVLSPKEWEPIKGMIYLRLKEAGRALHTSEVPQLLINLGLPSQVNTGHLLGILSSDKRYRKFRGGFTGLSIWKNPNRLTIPEALDQVLLDQKNTWDVSEIVGILQTLLGYSFDKNRISLHLSKNEFIFDRGDNLWKKTS